MSKLSLEEEAATEVDWLQLPEHLSFEILSKFTCFSDYIRFGAVSLHWRSLLFSDHCPILPPQPPLLIVPTPPPLHGQGQDAEVGVAEKKKRNKNKKKKKNTAITPTRSCTFYRITDNKVYNQLQLAMPYDRHFRGSGHGWLITFDDDGLFYPVRLINPFFFSHYKEIQLPPLSNFEDPDDCFKTVFLKKAILSTDPISNPKNYIVMVIYGGFKKLAFYKPNGGGGHKLESWTPIESEYEDYQGPFDDIIFYKDKFYAIHHYGELFVCDLEERIAMEIVEPMPGLMPALNKHLVESSGDLLLVLRIIDKEDYPCNSTVGFNIFKLDDPTGHYLDDPLADADEITPPKWVQVKDLHGCAIFLGYNGSLSVFAANFQRIKPNCIYYTDDDRETFHFNPGYGSQDIGLFNLEEEKIEKYYPTEMSKQILPPPIWIQPPKPQNIIRIRNRNRKKLIK